MISPEKMFGNLFDSKEITALRLLIFGKDLLVNMIAANTTHTYDVPIALLTPLLAQLETQVSSLDSILNLRSGQTDEVDLVTFNFIKKMSDMNGVIANALGGKLSIGYKEFYPLNMKDYDAANRATMHTLTSRVSVAATKYATELGVIITPDLQSFLPSYTAARSSQSTSTGTVNTSRVYRTVIETKTELALTEIVHFIAGKFPGDVVMCSSFFKFNLLFTVGHHKHTTHSGTLGFEEIKEIANQLFTDNWSIIIRNKGTNAAVEVWLGATALETTSVKLVTVQPGNAVSLKPSDLGDLKNSFLLIKNLSLVNSADYEIVIIG